MAPIVLSSSAGGNLTLTLDPKGLGGWCQVHLVVSDVDRPLGAERLKYVAASLASFLRESKTSGIRSVFGLSELHTSAYGEQVGEEAVLHFQDRGGKMFAKLVLTSADKRQWLETLVQYEGS
jgi:hypothetical protein